MANFTAMLAVPTPDHYLPLLYVIDTRRESEPVSFPVEGVDGRSISMLAVRLGWSSPQHAGRWALAEFTTGLAALHIRLICTQISASAPLCLASQPKHTQAVLTDVRLWS